MDYFAGLDVSVRTTSFCIMTAAGKVVREGKVESEPEALAHVLNGMGVTYGRVGSKLDRYVSGSTPAWRRLVFRLFVSRRGTPRPFSALRSTKRIATMREASHR